MTSTLQKLKLVSGIARWSRVVVIIVACLNYIFRKTHHPPVMHLYYLSYGLFIIILGLQFFSQRRVEPARALREILAENILITLGVVINPLNYAFFILYHVVLYRCGRNLPFSLGLIGVILTVCFELSGIAVWWSFGYLTLEHTPQYLYSFVFALPGWLLVFGIGSMFRLQTEAWEQTQALLEENQQQKEALERAHAELLKFALEVEEVAVLRERNRMAGEIHDTVGHVLTSVIRSADACSELLEDSANVQRVVRHMQAMREIAQESLTEIRQSVRALASETSWVNDWKVVLQRFAEHVYELANTTVYIDGVVDIPILERFTIYQCIKETVTNSIRHGKASEIKIHQKNIHNGYRIEILDNGTGVDTVKPGFGLNSIETRMHKIGGSAVYRSTYGKGFCVILWKESE